MMKFLLVALNAKYIHSNPGVYSLKAYADQYAGNAGAEIGIGEYTINQQTEFILKDIYGRKPDAIGFSCYIWNISCVMDLLRDIRKVLPRTDIWLGGPEVSYNAREVLEQEPGVSGIMMGEGEETFAALVRSYGLGKTVFEGIDGIAVRNADGEVLEAPCRPVMELDRIPFFYGDLKGLENRIIYYESSRGCPFSCSYCLSSIDKSVRFRSIDLVKKELDFFLEKKVPQVKFVDRTFNCKKSHSLAIWKYILDHDNGITNFHFEISADLLGEEELALMKQMRPGLIQLEIGVQSVNPKTISEIRRKMDLSLLKQAVAEVNDFHNIHQHLDLIAGLPFEGYESFAASFDAVYAMKPKQLQLGFLKILKGSYMAEMTDAYGLLYRSCPPYEVLATKWLSYDEVIRLKAVEEMVEVYYNSGQFCATVEALQTEFAGAFSMFEALAHEYEEKHLFEINHNRLARYEILYELICRHTPAKASEYRDRLILDLYRRENVKSRPGFASDQSPYKKVIRDFFISEAKNFKYLDGYQNYDSRQISKMAHLEVMEDGRYLLFDYLNRNPLDYNAKVTVLDL